MCSVLFQINWTSYQSLFLGLVRQVGQWLRRQFESIRYIFERWKISVFVFIWVHVQCWGFRIYLALLLASWERRGMRLPVLHHNELAKLYQFEPSFFFEKVEAHLSDIVWNDLSVLHFEVFQLTIFKTLKEKGINLQVSDVLRRDVELTHGVSVAVFEAAIFLGDIALDLVGVGLVAEVVGAVAPDGRWRHRLTHFVFAIYF